MDAKFAFLGVVVVLGLVFVLNSTSAVVYDVCEAMSDETVSYDDFQALIEAIYNGDCNEAMNVKTSFSMSHDDFSELAYTYEIVDTEGNPLVFYRTGAPSPIGAGAILVYGNDGDFPVKMGDYLQIWTSGSPKDIIIEVGMEGCDPYDAKCDAMCSYEEEHVCDPLCYVNNTAEDVQCDIDCVDVNNNRVIDEGDLDGICDLDCYNDDLDPKRAYDPDCVDVLNNDTICDPDSQGVTDGVCDPDCAPANHHCDFDCNATTYPGNPMGLNDTDCYECDGICNGFCSFDCTYLDHDPDCPAGFTDWFELTECCGNSKCGIGENCETCTADCPSGGDCSDLGVDFFCCPDAVNADMSGCAELTTGKLESENCTCAPECSDVPDKLLCTGPTGDKHCCPAGEVWNGTECKLGGDVLIVALKTNLLKPTGPYDDAQIEKLEGKIYDFIDALAVDGLGGSFFYLDEGMTSDVTPGGIKVTKPDDSADIDAVLNVLIPKMKSKYLIIIGGNDRFPQVYIGGNPFNGEPAHTDDKYGDIDGDNILDIPVGRLPDPNNGDINVILNALDTSIGLHRNGGLDLSSYTSSIMSTSVWDDGARYHRTTFSMTCAADARCVEPSDCQLAELSGKAFAMILLHGSSDVPQKFGCNAAAECGCAGWGASTFVPSKLTPLDVTDATWFTMCCSSCVIHNKGTTGSSVPLTFLKKGGALYLGGAGVVPGGNGCICELYIEIAKGLSVDSRIGSAFMQGKNTYLSNYNCQGGKTTYQYHIESLYGDPTLKIKNKW